MLVGAMLNKNNMKRPDIFEVSRIPSVRKAIIKFCDEHDCRDEVSAYFDFGEDRT
jgi:hypothetical protein